MDRFVTRISRNNYSQIQSWEMTPAEMIQFLEEGTLYRTFADVLRTACREQREAGINGQRQGKTDVRDEFEEESDSELTQRLATGLSSLTGQEYSATARKVRNWMNGIGAPQSREQLFQICFVLGLSEAQADRLIASASECGIHYRNPKELVYAFALRNGLSYEEAVKLWEEVEPVYTEETKRENSHHGGETQRVYTRQIRMDFDSVRAEEELMDFFREKGRWLGEIHETAYKKFVELLDELQQPEKGAERYPLEKVVEEYIRMHVPSTRQTKDMSYLQRVIKKNWPAESEIVKMKNRKMDVSRKVLLLLFLITEDFEFSSEPEAFGDESEDDLYYEDILEEDPAERLEIRLNKINLFLGNYGMNLLDPGSPFDCLVLYALRAQYDDAINENMKGTLEVLFGEE